MYLNPLILVIGAFALLLSSFGWIFIALSALIYFLAGYKKTTYHQQWTLGLFLTSFWITHLRSEREPTISLYPCGRTQGVSEGMCEVWSTAGFPFPSLHYFPAGDVPYLGMWPMFFLNALIFSALSLIIIRFMSKGVLENKWMRIGLLVIGVLMTLVGEATIMLRFD
jgi:hypothetical protein